MSKHIMLVFVLIVLIVTSQFEWRQPLVVDLDAATSLSQKQQQILDREEAVKEKIIISQERHIQKLNELVRSLQLQVLQCKEENETQNATKSYHLNKQFIEEVESKQILES